MLAGGGESLNSNQQDLKATLSIRNFPRSALWVSDRQLWHYLSNVCFSRGSQELLLLAEPLVIAKAWVIGYLWRDVDALVKAPCWVLAEAWGQPQRGITLATTFEFSLCETPSPLFLASGKLRTSWEWVKGLSKESLLARLNHISKSQLQHFSMSD